MGHIAAAEGFNTALTTQFGDEMSEVEVSKGKQDPELKHFGMAAVYSSREGRCAYYRLYRGNIPDVKTIDNFVDVAKAMGFSFRRVALDRGYCSYNNLLRLHHECRYDVIMCMKSNMVAYKDALESAKGTFEEGCSQGLPRSCLALPPMQSLPVTCCCLPQRNWRPTGSTTS